MDTDHHQQIQHSVNSTEWELEKVSPLVLVTHADGSEIRIYEPKLDGETKMEFSNWGTVHSMPSKKKFFDSLDESVDFLCDFVRR
jgi:hypothetical protein